MGTSSSSSRSTVIEQRNLLGGADLVARVGKGRAKARTLQVDPRWKVGFAAALALVVEHGKLARRATEVPARTRCPRCGREGLTEADFGTRVMRGGQRRVQSWCRSCRSRHAHAGPRNVPAGPVQWAFPL